MSTAPVLTIAIPTYNRARDLERLLAVLSCELRGLEGKVSLVICNNASTDGTRGVIERFAPSYPHVKVIHQPTNLGMDGNFCACVEQVDGHYFWLFGDDDLPRSGAIRTLLSLLEQETPDLVYLHSRWEPELQDNDPSHPVLKFDAALLNRMAFARRVHVWTTFLSGMVVRRTMIDSSPANLRRYTGTQLVQLGWVLGALKNGQRFIHVRTPSVLATSGNTGGYALLKVFGENFPKIVRDVFTGSRDLDAVARAVIKRTIVGFLPELVWGMRKATVGRFAHENAEEALRPQLHGSLASRCLVIPVATAPQAVARTVLSIARLMAKFLRVFDRFGERLSGAARSL